MCGFILLTIRFGVKCDILMSTRIVTTMISDRAVKTSEASQMFDVNVAWRALKSDRK